MVWSRSSARYTQTFLWLQRHDEGLLDDTEGHPGGDLPAPAVVMRALGEQSYPHVSGATIEREPQEVLLKQDLHTFLINQYQAEGITLSENDSVIHALQVVPASDLYDSNKTNMKWVSDGYPLKREDHKQKDLHLSFIDYINPNNNQFKVVNQLEIVDKETRISDAILYINGLPLVVFEFKSAIRSEATVHDAYKQLTTRYRRDIPESMKCNAPCIISDGINNKMGSLFANYEFCCS